MSSSSQAIGRTPFALISTIPTPGVYVVPAIGRYACVAYPVRSSTRTPAWSVGRSSRGIPDTSPATRTSEASGDRIRPSALATKVLVGSPSSTSRITWPSSPVPKNSSVPSGTMATPVTCAVSWLSASARFGAVAHVDDPEHPAAVAQQQLRVLAPRQRPDRGPST